MATSGFNPMIAGGGGLAGSGIANLFSKWNNPADAARGELENVPDVMTPYYMPYRAAGAAAIPQLETQYSNLVNNPGDTMNRIGGEYKQSPGLQFAIQQALQGSGHAAAAGGMAGSPQHEQQNMGLATNLATQDYNSWLDRAMKMYGIGIEGKQGLMSQGYNANNEMAQSIINNMLSKALLNYQGQNLENEHAAGGLQSLLTGAGIMGAAKYAMI